MAPITRNGGARKGGGQEGPEKRATKWATIMETTRDPRSGGIGKRIGKEKVKAGPAKGATKGGTTKKGGRGKAKAAKATRAAKGYGQLTVTKLYEELVQRGLPKTGRKAALVRRLEEADGQTKSPDLASVEPVVLPTLVPNSSVRPLNTRQTRTLAQHENAGGEHTIGIPKGICCSDTVNVSRLPSPFSAGEWGDRWKDFVHITDTHVSDQVRNMYLVLNPDSDEYEHRYESDIRKGFENGDIGFLAEVQEGEELEVTPFPLGDPRLSMNLPPLRRTNVTGSQSIEGVGAVFEARHCHNQKTNESGVFICDDKQNGVIVNDSMFGKDLLIGPLPDFAIIELAGHTLFWWGSRQGVDYIPNPELQHMEEDGDQVRSV